jgi:hypothetical protein
MTNEEVVPYFVVHHSYFILLPYLFAPSVTIPNDSIMESRVTSA